MVFAAVIMPIFVDGLFDGIDFDYIDALEKEMY